VRPIAPLLGDVELGQALDGHDGAVDADLSDAMRRANRGDVARLTMMAR
jgi:hypothetical protein